MDQNYDGPYYQPKLEDIDKRSDRMMFEFEITLDSRDVKWRGRDHTMEYVGGIVEVDD